MSDVRTEVRDGKGLLVGKEWLRGSGEPLTTVNPATGETNATIASASRQEIELAVAVARDAQSDESWAALLPPQRADCLHAISRLIVERAEPLARLVMQENGKTLTESRTQVRAAAGIFRYYASLCETLTAEVTPPRGSIPVGHAVRAARRRCGDNPMELAGQSRRREARTGARGRQRGHPQAVRGDAFGDPGTRAALP
jgi:acyl-CoA reductase-like NAD-dependent aldehyde dehydrogenase